MTFDDLKKELAASGWKFATSILLCTGVDWYAWKPLECSHDCTSNQKPPSIILTPWYDGKKYMPKSVEVDIAGDIGNDEWIKFRTYGIDPSILIKTLPKIERMLRAAWNAAYEEYNGPNVGE